MVRSSLRISKKWTRPISDSQNFLTWKAMMVTLIPSEFKTRVYKNTNRQNRLNKSRKKKLQPNCKNIPLLGYLGKEHMLKLN